VRNEITAALVVAAVFGAVSGARAASDFALRASDFAPGASSDRSSDTSDSALSVSPDKDVNGISRARVQVRVYDGAGVPAADQTVALRAAAGVLAAAGIDVTWVACGRGDSAMNPVECDAPIGRNELAIRLLCLPGAPTPRGELPLGYSLVDTRAAAGSLATIYVDRIAWLSAQAEVGAAKLLGHAIAHEIGHLLLGTNAHGSAGLMRAVWSRAELRRHHPADWLFARSEGAAMRQSLQHRDRQARMASTITGTR
jgi:hypothetical protein